MSVRSYSSIAIYLFIICYNFAGGWLYSHGLSESTSIKTWNGCKKLKDITNKVSKNKNVVSYKFRKNRCTSGNVRSAGKSESNCYMRIGFDDTHFLEDDLLCTPAQEFYIPAEDKWLPACQLKVGDVLKSYSVGFKAITSIAFVEKPLTIFIIEVEKYHNFFAGKYFVLTHNTTLPWECSLAFSLPFGAGGGAAAGGKAGGYFGPAGIVGGIVIGGILGWALESFGNSDKVHHYEAIFDIGVIDAHLKGNSGQTQPSSPVTVNGPKSSMDPNDPEKKKPDETKPSERKECEYKDATDPRSRYPNAKTDMTREEFEKNLQQDGWKQDIRGGKNNVVNYEKDGVRYAVRNGAASTGEPAVDYYKPGSDCPDGKIRLLPP